MSPKWRFSSEQKHQAVDLVLHSKSFGRSDQLKRFLGDMCEMEEVGQTDEITEYSFGTDALGCPRDYSNTAWYSRLKIPDMGEELYMYYGADAPLFRDAEAALFATCIVSAAAVSFTFCRNFPCKLPLCETTTCF